MLGIVQVEIQAVWRTPATWAQLESKMDVQVQQHSSEYSASEDGRRADI